MPPGRDDATLLALELGLERGLRAGLEVARQVAALIPADSRQRLLARRWIGEAEQLAAEQVAAWRRERR